MHRIADLEAIIFDFGGVIIDIDYQKTKEALIHLLDKDHDEHFSQAAQSSLFDDIETGKIEPASFRDGLRAIAKDDSLDDDVIDHAWNLMLGGSPSINSISLSRWAKICLFTF